jgi:hypothetical protein
MKKALFVALLLAASCADLRGRHYPGAVTIQGTAPTTFINNLSLDAPRVFQIAGVGGYSNALLIFDFTHSAATSVTMVCTGSIDGGTTKAVLQDVVFSAGVGTSSDKSRVKAVVGDKVWPWTVDGIRGFRDVECTVTSAAGAAGDLLTVTGYLTT